MRVRLTWSNVLLLRKNCKLIITYESFTKRYKYHVIIFKEFCCLLIVRYLWNFTFSLEILPVSWGTILRPRSKALD